MRWRATGLVAFTAALFAMMNPIGNTGIFASMTKDKPVATQRRVAWVAALAAMIIGLATLWAGPVILKFLGICVLTGALFSVAGPIALRLGPAGINIMTRVMGLLLAAIAMGMLAQEMTGLFPQLLALK